MNILNLSFDKTINYLISEDYLYTNPIVSINTFKLIIILNDNYLAEKYNNYDIIIEEYTDKNNLINNVIAYIQYGYIALSIYDMNNKNITNIINNHVNTIVPKGNKKTNYWYEKQGILNFCNLCEEHNIAPNDIIKKCDQCYSKLCSNCIKKIIKCYCGCGLIIYCENCKYCGKNNIKKCFCDKYFYLSHKCLKCKI
jgi:hypothetical protein